MLEQSLQDGKERLEQLQQQLDALQRKHEQLSRENNLLHSTVGWLEGAAKRRALAPGVQRSHPLFDDEFTGSAAARQSVRPLFDDAHNAMQLSRLSVRQLLEMLPLSTMTASLDGTHLHRQIMSLTPKAAAVYWNQAVKDLNMLRYLYERDPLVSSREMGVMVNELLRWSCACYVFNPSVLQALCDVNMSTMRHHPAPAEHWQAAWEAAGMTETQLRQIRALRDFTCNKLDSLNAERQQLADELAQLGAAASAAAHPAPGGQPLQDTPADSTGSCSSTNSGLIERRRWEVAQQLVCVTKARQVLVQLRSQLVVMILEPVQAARIVCAVYPYMLLGGPLYQHLPSDSADDAACSVCGNGIAASEDSTSTSSSGGHNNQEPAVQLLQKELPVVLMHPAWCGVARLPQLQHLPQQLTGPFAYLSGLIGPGLTRWSSWAAVGRPGGYSLAAAAAAGLPTGPLRTGLTAWPGLAAVGLTAGLLPGLPCPHAGLTVQPGLVVSAGLMGQGLTVRPSLAAPSELASLMHDADDDIAVVGDNYS